jgi:hypothetical protein
MWFDSTRWWRCCADLSIFNLAAAGHAASLFVVFLSFFLFFFFVVFFFVFVFAFFVFISSFRFSMLTQSWSMMLFVVVLLVSIGNATAVCNANGFGDGTLKPPSVQCADVAGAAIGFTGGDGKLFLKSAGGGNFIVSTDSGTLSNGGSGL